MASTSGASSKILRGQKIEGCFLQAIGSSTDVNRLSSQPQPWAESLGSPLALPLQVPVTLRIFFDSSKHTAFFRLYTTVELEINTQTCPMPFFLDISPDKIHDLSLDTCSTESAPQPSLAARCLNFRMTGPGSISLIAPQAIEPGHLRPTTHAAWVKLEYLRLLAKQLAVCVVLPSAAENLALDSCCEAVSAQRLFVTPLRPDPGQATLRTLYRGDGGRVVDVDNEVFLVPPPSDPPSSSDQPPPPAYDGVSVASQAPNLHSSSPTTPCKPAKGKKRARIPSPQTPSSERSSPDYRTWEHFKLAVGEREKMMAELLRRADKKEMAMNKLLAQVGEETRHLAELVAAAKEREAALQDRGIVAGAVTDEPGQLPPLQADTASPGAVSSTTSTASIASNISDRVQVYVATQFTRLRDELQGLGYVTADEVEDLLDGRFVEEDAMFEAIRDAVDEHIGQIRERVLEAWL